MVVHQSNVIYRLSETHASMMANYRFMDNEKVSIADLIGKVVSPTVAACADRDILIISDSTEISMDSCEDHITDWADLGVLSDNKTPGFHIHASIALDAASGHGLGLSDLVLWNRVPSSASKQEKAALLRKRSLEEKEIYKWHLGIEKSLEVACQAREKTFIFDQGANFSYLWHEVEEWDAHFLIRGSRDWKTAQNGIRLFEHIESFALAGKYELELRELNRHNYSKNKAQKRKARTAEIAVRFGPVRLKPSTRVRPRKTKELDLFFVDAKESKESLPAGEQAVHWTLLTTHQIASYEDACKMIRWYEKRWMIEQLFRIIKRKGFDIESTELTQTQAIFKQSILTLEAGFRVLQLLLAREQDPKNTPSIDRGFNAQEQKCLQALCKKLEGKTDKLKNPFPHTQLAFASWVIARLGGWKGYQSQAPPGPITFKRGLDKFRQIFQGWSIFANEIDMYNT